jgi:diguanylate cyclase (GGDEF)-like protein
MLAKVIQARAVAAVAVFGLAIGLVTLAGLALWGTTSTQRAASEVKAINQVGDAWGQVFQRVNLEDETMRDYLRARRSSTGRSASASAIGGATPSLDWLEQYGGPGEQDNLGLVRDTYAGYTDTLREMLTMQAAHWYGKVDLLSVQADLGASSVRRQVIANIDRKRLEAKDYLSQVEIVNRRLRTAATVAFGIDLLLLLLCSVVLVGYQRRIKGQAERSRHQALHDSLTGLANRALLADRTEHAIAQAARRNEAVGLLLLDLDGFKEVNDTLGHHCGDLLLQRVAERLTGSVREVDTVARLGGDEFAVLLPAVGSIQQAVTVARRVREALCQPAEVDGLVIDLSGSIGVALYPEHSADSSHLLQHADIAMYTAKRGQLGVSVYDPHLDQHTPNLLSLPSELRRAIDQGELVLHYQPKADMESGRIRGVEALVRWQHAERGLLSPAQFIPLAESSGLIEDLTRYVIEDAVGQCRQWQLAGLDLPIAVNVGARCLLDTSFPQKVAELLAAQELPADMLTLELTESAIITDPVRAIEVLSRLQGLGIRLSIDDFGTGYSSMAYLRTLPLDELKIDRSFISHIQSEDGDRAIVRAVLDLARSLDLDVVAEGVEDQETWTMLRDLGCATSQGFYLSRPMPPGDVPGWLAEQSAKALEAVAGSR